MTNIFENIFEGAEVDCSYTREEAIKKKEVY